MSEPISLSQYEELLALRAWKKAAQEDEGFFTVAEANASMAELKELRDFQIEILQIVPGDMVVGAVGAFFRNRLNELIELRARKERLGDPDHWFENLNDHLRGCAWAEADEEYDELADQCRALLKRAKGEA